MTTETLMTEAATTTEGATASEQATQQPATGAEDGSQQQQPEGQEAQGQPAEGAETEGEQAEKPAGAPENYEFSEPEGVKIDEKVIGAFSEVAKGLNLTQEQAQKVLNDMAPVLAQQTADGIGKQLQTARSEWVETAKADAEFGGAKLEENLGIAKKALETFATPELRKLLNESGLGDHPEVIRMFYRTGKAISEDRFVSGQGGKPAQGDARSLYEKSNMNP